MQIIEIKLSIYVKFNNHLTQITAQCTHEIYSVCVMLLIKHFIAFLVSSNKITIPLSEWVLIVIKCSLEQYQQSVFCKIYVFLIIDIECFIIGTKILQLKLLIVLLIP